MSLFLIRRVSTRIDRVSSGQREREGEGARNIFKVGREEGPIYTRVVRLVKRGRSRKGGLIGRVGRSTKSGVISPASESRIAGTSRPLSATRQSFEHSLSSRSLSTHNRPLVSRPPPLLVFVVYLASSHALPLSHWWSFLLDQAFSSRVESKNSKFWILEIIKRRWRGVPRVRGGKERSCGVYRRGITASLYVGGGR